MFHRDSFYSQASDTPSWLDAMSGDKSFIDPRTFEVHRIASWPSPLGSSHPVIRINLDKINSRSHNIFVLEWVDTMVGITENAGYSHVPANDVDAIEDVDFCSLVQELGPWPLPLEAVPPCRNQSIQFDLDNIYYWLHGQSGHLEPHGEGSVPLSVADSDVSRSSGSESTTSATSSRSPITSRTSSGD